MIEVIRLVIWAYIAAMVVYALLSWFPIDPGTPLARVNAALASIIEPVIRPVRRVVPPVAGLDLSFMVVMIGLYIVLRYL